MVTEDRMKAHQSVLDHIEHALLSGSLPVGAQLPPERDLALQLGVSRGAVREAIRVLQAQGILESQPGPGHGTRITAGQTKALGRIFRLHLALASTSLSDLTETRIALERSTAALAAKNWQDDALSQLKELVDQMDNTFDLDEFNALDTDFHVALANTARNPFVGDLTTAIRDALKGPIRTASQQMVDWQRLRMDLCTQHREIFDAVSERDCERAAHLVELHIRTAYAILGMGQPDTQSAPTIQ